MFRIMGRLDAWSMEHLKDFDRPRVEKKLSGRVKGNEKFLKEQLRSGGDRSRYLEEDELRAQRLVYLAFAPSRARVLRLEHHAGTGLRPSIRQTECGNFQIRQCG
jgi:hypothetical protein